MFQREFEERTSFDGLEQMFTVPLILVFFSAVCYMGFLCETILKEHCIAEVVSSEFCFTRSPSIAEIIKKCKGTMHM